MAQSKVLIVEDDEGLREALIDTLALAGYEWLEADCAEDACSNSNHTVSILWCLMCKWQAWGDSLCCAVSNSTGRIYPYC